MALTENVDLFSHNNRGSKRPFCDNNGDYRNGHYNNYNPPVAPTYRPTYPKYPPVYLHTYPTYRPTYPTYPTYRPSYYGGGNRDNYVDNAPGSFTVFKFFLFGLLIASPCLRAIHLWWSGGGRIRLRRSEGDSNRVVGLQYIPPMDNWFGANEVTEAERPVPRLTREQVMGLPEIIYRKPVFPSEDFVAKGKTTSIDTIREEEIDDTQHTYNEEDDDKNDDDRNPVATAVTDLLHPIDGSTNSGYTTTTTDGKQQLQQQQPFDAGGEVETVTLEQSFENEPSVTAATLVPIRLQLPTSPERVPSTFTAGTGGEDESVTSEQSFENEPSVAAATLAPIRLQLPTSPERVPSTFTDRTDGDDGDESGDPPVSPRAIAVVPEELPPDEEQPEEQQQLLPPDPPPLVVVDDDDDVPPPLSFRTQRKLGNFTTTTCTSCSICLDDFEEGERLRLLPKCGHAFHTECILPWLTDRQGCCPLCKTPVLDNNNQNAGSNNITNSNSDGNGIIGWTD